jgi:hypothetical protein
MEAIAFNASVLKEKQIIIMGCGGKLDTEIRNYKSVVVESLHPLFRAKAVNEVEKMTFLVARIKFYLYYIWSALFTSVIWALLIINIVVIWRGSAVCESYLGRMATVVPFVTLGSGLYVAWFVGAVNPVWKVLVSGGSYVGLIFFFMSFKNQIVLPPPNVTYHTGDCPVWYNLTHAIFFLLVISFGLCKSFAELA